MSISAKYSRTFHLPFSPGASSDDKILGSISGLLGKPIVVSQKMDGANLCFTKDSVYARTHRGPATGSSFDLAKQKHAALKSELNDTISVFVEYLYAVHTIKYHNLPDYFMVIGIRDDTTGFYWSWPKVEAEALRLNLPTVPVLMRGTVQNEAGLKTITAQLMALESPYGTKEGLVFRTESQFHQDDFDKYIGKFVRKDHCIGDHWSKRLLEINQLEKL